MIRKFLNIISSKMKHKNNNNTFSISQRIYLTKRDVDKLLKGIPIRKIDEFGKSANIVFVEDEDATCPFNKEINCYPGIFCDGCINEYRNSRKDAE